jgi:hypothetical protein
MFVCAMNSLDLAPEQLERLEAIALMLLGAPVEERAFRPALQHDKFKGFSPGEDEL